MLELKNITKVYKVGEETQYALNDVSLSFRNCEFVSILGHSGSGKTTLLNIVGGLDRYTDGDLKIDNISTKQYKDSDWDSYRNYTIGFVFQSYNLIPHSTVLANVEMALTLGGVNKKERRERAKQVLEMVGLKDHMNKKPNQMSGGQMQRVAIARALINNPSILLADEPTGALDSETSVQIMNLLKEIAKDRLVIMVTHNPDLAKEYSTRIVQLSDGKIISDSNPYEIKNEEAKVHTKRKVSMSFKTALALSFNNLKTKKGRTILTSLAGSIGIIGIALILALSTGMSKYINDIQADTMTVYPITITDKTIDTNAFLNLSDFNNEEQNEGEYVFINYKDVEASTLVNSSIKENNLTEFKKYLDDKNSEIHKYVGKQGIIYGYDVKFNVFSEDKNKELINTNASPNDTNSMIQSNPMQMGMSMMLGNSVSQTHKNFSEILKGVGDNLISDVVKDSYDVVYGKWPEKYDELVLIVGKNNDLSTIVMYQLGLITLDEYKQISEQITNGEKIEKLKFSYEDILNKELYLIPTALRYEKNSEGNFTYISDSKLNHNKIKENSIKVKFTGIVKSNGDGKLNITTNVGYLSSLSDYVITQTNNSEVIKAQDANPNINVLTGFNFASNDKQSKLNDIRTYLLKLSDIEKIAMIKTLLEQGGSKVPDSVTNEVLIAQFNSWVTSDQDETMLLLLHDEFIGESSYKENMNKFGLVSLDAPSQISIYTDSFEGKDGLSLAIENYNSNKSDDHKIYYTDYVALLTSSLTTIIDGISYVLIAFVAISLVVSSIMIGIITHISVLERTKEIGILRALGASKGNISQVFNAETFIIGCLSGILGILVSLVLIIPINMLIRALTEINDLGAYLKLSHSIVLVIISVIITIIGGLIPSRKAAQKDPVIALRTE